MSILQASGLSYAVDGKPLVVDAGFRWNQELTALIGPNGSGKTTCCASRSAFSKQKPVRRRSMASRSLGFRRSSGRARSPTCRRPDRWSGRNRFATSFRSGGSPMAQLWGGCQAGDEAAVSHAIEACQLDGFEERAADTLSGGELARVHLARALAAETPLVIADEPVAALDPRYQHQTMRLFASMAQSGHGVLTVVHDLDLALRYANRVLWMHEGRIVRMGRQKTPLPASVCGACSIQARFPQWRKFPARHLAPRNAG